MRLSPWLRPSGISRTQYAIGGLLWLLLCGIVWTGIVLAAWGLLGLLARVFT